jgi:hypothetical protein
MNIEIQLSTNLILIQKKKKKIQTYTVLSQLTYENVSHVQNMF